MYLSIKYVYIELGIERRTYYHACLHGNLFVAILPLTNLSRIVPFVEILCTARTLTLWLVIKPFLISYPLGSSAEAGRLTYPLQMARP
jgi:hypothetical protein